MRRHIPRGWAPPLLLMARFTPSLQQYRARLDNSDYLYLDLRERMCYGFFFDGEQATEIGTDHLLSRVLKDGDFFVDVGANVGYYTRFASRIVGPEGTVLAYEPNPTAFRLLRMNTEQLSNTTIFQKALSDQKGEAIFYIRRHGEMSSLGADSGARPIRVDVSTLDAELAAYPRVDFIKIDVEGFEMEVLRGASETLSVHRPIVYFEFIQAFAAERGFKVADYETFFRKFNYTLRWINHSRTDSRLFGETPSNYLVALPNSRTELQ
jgi:FkbM family methyltransferase